MAGLQGSTEKSLNEQTLAMSCNMPEPRYTSLSFRAWSRHLRRNVIGDMFPQLFLMAFVAGMIDCETGLDYGVFVSRPCQSMVLFVVYGLGIVSPMKGFYDNACTCVASFILGAAFFWYFGRIIGPRRRIWLVLSTAIQAVLVFSVSFVSNGNLLGARTQASIEVALLSLSAAGHIALALNICIPNKMTTDDIPLACVSVFSDPLLCPSQDQPKDISSLRRVFLFMATLFAGVFAGAGLHCVVDASAIWAIIATAKALIGLSFLMDQGTTRYQQEREEREHLIPLEHEALQV